MRLAICVTACVMPLLAAATLPPAVIILPRGEAEVRFETGCIVQYDHQGVWTHSRPGCPPAARRQADLALTAWRSAHGQPPLPAAAVDRAAPVPASDRRGGGVPAVVVNPNGTFRAALMACIGHYGRDGLRRYAAGRGCRAATLGTMDSAVAAVRREQGY